MIPRETEPSLGAAACRLHGETGGPTLVYLPGLHGDATLIGGLRGHLPPDWRFAELVYPRRSTGTMAELANSVVSALLASGISQGIVVAESFGSQVAWEILRSAALRFRMDRLILAGGFVTHPWPWAVRWALGTWGRTPSPVFDTLVRIYPGVARTITDRWDGRPAALRAFVKARHAPGDRAAMRHRLGLILGSDYRAVAAGVRFPVFQLSGLWDPIVPWRPVRDGLRSACPGFQGSRILATADHAVLVTRPRAVARWLGEECGLC